MKLLLVPAAALVLAWTLNACKQGAGTAASFCDTACLKDSIRFIKEEHPLRPAVYISAKDCSADTVIWTYENMGANRKLAFKDLFGSARINRNYVSCFIKDTSYAWLAFNDCSNGRGYLLKIPFSKSQKISNKSSAVNSFDPKFSVAPGLVAYSDRGNLFTEDMATGKQAMMTFGEKLDIDYDAIHEYVDSVNITPTRIWAKVKL
ncbi:MAG: hypothetical protein ABW019_07585, partial [Chitinophagaceae bacterium]